MPSLSVPKKSFTSPGIISIFPAAGPPLGGFGRFCPLAGRKNGQITAESHLWSAEEMRAILDGRDSRLMLMIGPCSADREDSVMDYIYRLVPLQEQVKDKILIVPRIYTNKPRTNGAGYKGMLHQPDPSKKPDMLEGIIAIRRLHTRAVEETGFACADEMLYPENYRYLSVRWKTSRTA